MLTDVISRSPGAIACRVMILLNAAAPLTIRKAIVKHARRDFCWRHQGSVTKTIATIITHPAVATANATCRTLLTLSASVALDTPGRPVKNVLRVIVGMRVCATLIIVIRQ